MIDLVEAGRRLWETIDADPNAQADDAQPVTNLVEQGRQLWEATTAPFSATRSASFSAGAKPDTAGLSAIQQNQHSPAPVREIETIISSLVNAGRDVDARLAHQLRETMAPLSRRERADLAIAVDDALASTDDLDEASRKALALLGDATARAARRETIGGRVPWIEWIAERCALLAEDRAFICQRMRTLPPRVAERTAMRYVDAWHAAADAEPQHHLKANRGRAAANRSLLAVVKR